MEILSHTRNQLKARAGQSTLRQPAKRIKLAMVIEPYARSAAPYAIDILASFWFCECLTGFWI